MYEFLTNLGEQEHEGSLLSAWASALDVEPQDVVLHLGRVADLLRDTQLAVDETEEQTYVEAFSLYRASWARPVVPVDQAFSDRLINFLPEPPAVTALGMISVHLHSTAPEGSVPADDEIDQFRSRLSELIGEVKLADEIPDDLRHLILKRLRGVQDALDHLDIGGPSAVRHATEAVIGSVALATKGVGFDKYATVRKVCSLVAVAWTIFSVPATMQNSLEAWERDIPRLIEAVEMSPEPDAAEPEVTGRSTSLDGGTEAPEDPQ